MRWLSPDSPAGATPPAAPPAGQPPAAAASPPPPATPPPPTSSPAAAAPPADWMDRQLRSDARLYRLEQDLRAEREARAAAQGQLEAIKKDPWPHLKNLGHTPATVLEHAATGEAGPSERELALERELAEIKSWKEQQTQEKQTEREQSHVSNLTTQARRLVSAANDPDAAAMLAVADAMAEGQADFGAMVQTYMQQSIDSGMPLTPESAAQMLRGTLAARARAMRSNQALRKAWAALLGPDGSSAQPATQAGQPAQPGQTLTSGLAQAAAGAPPDTSKMTEPEFDAYIKQKYGR